jgi:hypothetical protein
VLSVQALYILKQFQSSGASKVLELKMYCGSQYIFIELSGTLEICEPSFLGGDIKSLVEFNLLRHKFNSKGDNIYIYQSLIKTGI